MTNSPTTNAAREGKGDLHISGPSAADRMTALAPAIERYLDLGLRFGTNLQPGQDLEIICERPHLDLARKVAESGYKMGARYISVTLIDPWLEKLRADLCQRAGDLDYAPSWLEGRFDYHVENQTARLFLDGEEDPDVLSKCDPERLAHIAASIKPLRKRYDAEGINQSKVHWSVLGIPTDKWAKEVFPDLETDEARAALWSALISVCRVDSDDWIQRWTEHDARLRERCAMLNELGIDTLHFTGPGTDLKVGLLDRSIFCGGSQMSDRGVSFWPNIPTEEVYTSPDYRKTEGIVATTRPFLLNGTFIKGLKLTFSGGEIVDFDAEEGKEAFAAYIEIDAGAKRVGEVALVGIDSPIYQTGLLFHNTLYDENAACHIAIGSSYGNCIAGSSSMTPEQLLELGANDSAVHDDIMISSEEVSVTAATRDGREVPLLLAGRWV